MADVNVKIVRGNEIFREINRTITQDKQNLSDFCHTLKIVQKSTNEALQQLVSSGKDGDQMLIEAENDEEEDECDDSSKTSRKREKEDTMQRTRSRKKLKRR